MRPLFIVGALFVAFGATVTTAAVVARRNVGKVVRRDRADDCDDAIQAWLDWWAFNGPFTINLTAGSRNDAGQLVEWSKGRKVKSAIGPKADDLVIGPVVTQAKFATETAHGKRYRGSKLRAQAVDCAVLEGGDLRYPDLVPAGPERDRLLGLYRQLRQSALDHGLTVIGEWDLPHVETRDWRQLPTGGVA